MLGTGALARHLVHSIQRNPWLPDDIKGVLSDTLVTTIIGTFRKCPSWTQQPVPRKWCSRDSIRCVYIALPLRLTHQLETLHEMLFDSNVDIIWAPEHSSPNLINHSVREVSCVPLVTLSESPLISGDRAFLKSVMDKLLGSTGMIILSPLMIAVAIAIRLDSKGPILFKQQRHGWDGKEFEFTNFAACARHLENQGTVTQATRGMIDVSRAWDDLSRKTSIDELLVLFNVLNGSMSLVEPRPHAIPHNEYSFGGRQRLPCASPTSSQA